MFLTACLIPSHVRTRMRSHAQEQMTAGLLESELLFLNSEEGAYELEGDIASTPLPTSLSESIRLRLAKVAERDASLDTLLKLCAALGMCQSRPRGGGGPGS